MTIRWVVIAIAALYLLYIARKAGRHKSRWVESIAPMAWLVHLILFFIAAQFHILPPTYLNVWSSAIHIHAIIAFATCGMEKRL